MISDAGPHPYFRTLIEGDARDRRRLSVGSLGAAGALQADMADLGVDTFAVGAAARPQWPLAAVRLARLMRARRTQLVQAHLVDGCLVGLAAARLARVPVAVMTAHHSHELPFHGARLRAVDRICAGPLSDRVIAPSQAVAETLVELAGADPEKIAVVHHGFDMQRLDPATVSGDAVRRELGLGDTLVVGALGRLYWLKDQEALVRAFAGVLRGADARLLLVGDGDASHLTALAAQQGIADQLVISPARRDVPELLAAMDVFAHPALAESFGMVIIEAMAMQRPILSTPVGIAPEVVRTGETGVLAAATGAEALAAGLREMLALRPRWALIGSAARAEVAGFTARRMADRYEELYEQWLAEAR